MEVPQTSTIISPEHPAETGESSASVPVVTPVRIESSSQQNLGYKKLRTAGIVVGGIAAAVCLLILAGYFFPSLFSKNPGGESTPVQTMMLTCQDLSVPSGVTAGQQCAAGSSAVTPTVAGGWQFDVPLTYSDALSKLRDIAKESGYEPIVASTGTTLPTTTPDGTTKVEFALTQLGAGDSSADKLFSGFTVTYTWQQQ